MRISYPVLWVEQTNAMGSVFMPRNGAGTMLKQALNAKLNNFSEDKKGAVFETAPF